MTIHIDRPAWQQHAACHGMTALFFPGRGEDARPARAICAGCPVRTECLDFAIDGGDHHGVFGGTSERERRSLRRGDNAKRVIALRAACGTRSGYARHRKEGTPACEACRQAATRYTTDRRRAQRGAA